MFKIACPIKRVAFICSKNMHIMRHEWHTPTKVPSQAPYEANPDSSVSLTHVFPISIKNKLIIFIKRFFYKNFNLFLKL